MATKHPIPLSRSERQFWRQAFLAAELTVLLKGGRRMSPEGAAHLAAEYANAAVAEDRAAKHGEQL